MDVVDIKNGYARYLIRYNRAKPANKDTLKWAQKFKDGLVKEDQKKRDNARHIRDLCLKIGPVLLVRSATESGKMHGSVSTKDIAKFYSEKGCIILAKDIKLSNKVRIIGSYEVPVLLHSNVMFNIVLHVTSSQSALDAISQHSLKNTSSENQGNM